MPSSPVQAAAVTVKVPASEPAAALNVRSVAPCDTRDISQDGWIVPDSLEPMDIQQHGSVDSSGILDPAQDEQFVDKAVPCQSDFSGPLRGDKGLSPDQTLAQPATSLESEESDRARSLSRVQEDEDGLMEPPPPRQWSHELGRQGITDDGVEVDVTPELESTEVEVEAVVEANQSSSEAGADGSTSLPDADSQGLVRADRQAELGQGLHDDALDSSGELSYLDDDMHGVNLGGIDDSGFHDLEPLSSFGAQATAKEVLPVAGGAVDAQDGGQSPRSEMRDSLATLPLTFGFASRDIFTRAC